MENFKAEIIANASNIDRSPHQEDIRHKQRYQKQELNYMYETE
jgi:hypothetical protein